MKNINYIIKNDIMRICKSVVALVIVFGLCVVPCLYAWFNIFSNWDPYGEDATSRLSVAVVSEDEGTEIFGLRINAGEELKSGLLANTQIGWTFEDSRKDALKGLRAGDYYAAIIVPAGFSRDCLSFITGELIHPTLQYYENDKKNAVAPQITSKARSAVQAEINSTIVETLTTVITDAVYMADVNGLDIAAASQNLAGRLRTIDDGAKEAAILLDSASNLTLSTKSLLTISEVMLDDADETLDASKDLLDGTSENLAEGEKGAGYALEETADALRDNAECFKKIYANLEKERKNIANVTGMDLGELDGLLNLISSAQADSNTLASDIEDSLSPDLLGCLSSASTTASDLALLMNNIQASNPKAREIIANSYETLDALSLQLSQSKLILNQSRQTINSVIGLLNTIGYSKDFASLTDAILKDGDLIGQYLAEPIKSTTEVIYEIESYGSAMTPFYTVLAQWVGALLTAVLLKPHMVMYRPEGLKMPEEFFGRYAAYFIVAAIQAIMVAAGNLWYIGIQCIRPGLFILATLITGLCFSMINYALVYSLDNIGLCVSVIMLVIQVAGAGGTFPVQLLPRFFRGVNPAMPFVFAMNALKETIGGMYENTYGYSILMLLIITLLFAIIGLALYYPALKLNKMIAESKADSNIMN